MLETLLTLNTRRFSAFFSSNACTSSCSSRLAGISCSIAGLGFTATAATFAAAFLAGARRGLLAAFFLGATAFFMCSRIKPFLPDVGDNFLRCKIAQRQTPPHPLAQLG